MKQKFEIKNNTLIKYNGTDKIVKIPDNIKEIDSDSFFCKRDIEKIILPNKLKAIYSNAFKYCENLKEINLPNTLTYIGAEALSNCDSLEEIKIPPNLDIYDSFLEENENLKKIIINGEYSEHDVNLIIGCDNPKLVEVIGPNIICEDGVVYNKDKTVLITYLESKKEKYFKVPDNVKKICKYAFTENKYLEKLCLHDQIEKIENCAINMDLIKKIIIPANIKTMDEDLITDIYADNIEIIIKGTKKEFEQNENLKFLTKKYSKINFIKLEDLIEEGKNFREANQILKQYSR